MNASSRVARKYLEIRRNLSQQISQCDIRLCFAAHYSYRWRRRVISFNVSLTYLYWRLCADCNSCCVWQKAVLTCNDNEISHHTYSYCGLADFCLFCLEFVCVFNMITQWLISSPNFILNCSIQADPYSACLNRTTKCLDYVILGVNFW